MRSCSVAGCRNVFGVHNKSFHRFPYNKEIKEKWIKFIKLTRDDWQSSESGEAPSSNQVICQDHFLSSDYEYSRGGSSTKLRLRSSAIPSILVLSHAVPSTSDASGVCGESSAEPKDIGDEPDFDEEELQALNDNLDDDSDSSSGSNGPVRRKSTRLKLTTGAPKPKPREKKKQHKCPHCPNRLFRSPTELSRHLRSQGYRKPYICPTCSSAFTTLGALQKHRKTHKVEKKYYCPQCPDKVFKVPSQLKSHSLQHQQEKPHQCPHCPKNFKQPSALQQHILRHTGEQPYKCPYCGVPFQVPGNLWRHMAGHTRTRPYTCPYCSTNFTSSCNLHGHLLLHVKDDQPYKCLPCALAFSDASMHQMHLVTHIQTQEEQEAPPPEPATTCEEEPQAEDYSAAMCEAELEDSAEEGPAADGIRVPEYSMAICRVELEEPPEEKEQMAATEESKAGLVQAPEEGTRGEVVEKPGPVDEAPLALLSVPGHY
ncbi:uncharacterized protein LOC143018278 isoform X1 [Oratosquilla oratoria]|uniref:uncharacterized protein LOC143018278 isoform X1 n=1 Tax=Oratosquilla oratoria TaxID=337810 RepID=UPI003F774656